MAITYEEALGTLESMFSDQGYTPQQLDAVLRHHGGHMENTVETLLSHGGGTPDELIRKLPGLPPGGTAANGDGGGGHAHNLDADEELARQLAAQDDRQQRRGRPQGATRSSGLGLAGAFGGFPGQRRPQTAPKPARPAAAARPKPPAGTKGRGTPVVLPDDFLRIPGRKYPAASDGAAGPIASAAGTGQTMTDEQLARMLQDELFQEELRNNPEFSHLAGRRNPSARSSFGPGGQRIPATSVQATGRSQHAGAGGGERNEFFERMSGETIAAGLS